jgi:Leucine-rich repeat (LRR) protein
MCIVCSGNYDQNTTMINCNNCKFVKKIPPLKGIKYLYCGYTNITEIPFLPNLEILHCSNTKIKNIPMLPKLRKLTCIKTQIKQIFNLPELFDLTCEYSAVTNIGELPKLVCLDCRNTPIEYIPELQRLRLLLCDDCNHLYKINVSCLIVSNRCQWIEKPHKSIALLKKTQAMSKKYLKRRDFISRILLNRFLYFDIIQIIMAY